jgi:putative ABC transport system permease protein
VSELFGIPTERLTWVLVAGFGAGALILIVLAVRDRTSLRMAVRNVPRRKTQTALIVTGLMLATLLFSAAFTTGDTLTESLRAQALENIGRVDVVVRAERPESGGGVAFGPGAGAAVVPEAREKYFDESLAYEVRDRLSGVESVVGVAPLAKETVPVTSPESDLSEPVVDVLGMDAGSMRGFDVLKTASDKTLSVGDLEKNEAYVSQDAAEGLGIVVGDKVEASLVQPKSAPGSKQPPSGLQNEQRPDAAQGRPGALGTGEPPARVGNGARPPGVVGNGRPATPQAEARPSKFEVAGVYERGANPASDTSMVMPLENLQALVDEEGRVNEVLITHGRPAVKGGEHTDATVSAIEPLLTDNGLEADPVKKDAVDGADQRGEIFSTLFVLFGQFSVAAGILLIFLIFVMLAAERKRELGIARAVGMQRSNLIRAFAFEGALWRRPPSVASPVSGSAGSWSVSWVRASPEEATTSGSSSPLA